MTTKKRQAERAEAIERLHALLAPGQSITATVLHVSQSGMARDIMLQIVDQRDGEIYDISWLTARALDLRVSDNGGVRVTGCGMDMGFHLVYELGRVMFPQGFPCTGSRGYTSTGRRSKHPRCMSNDHVNRGGCEYRRGRIHGDGGYAFKRA